MIYDSQNHHRESIRLKGYDYAQPGAYFVTVCTWQRAFLFGKIENGDIYLSKAGQIAQSEWLRLAKRFQNVDFSEFVVMPNHVHGIIVFIDTECGRGTAENGNDLVIELTRRAPTIAKNSRCVPPSAGDSDLSPIRERFGHPVAGSIPTIVRSYKSAVTLRVNHLFQVNSAPLWQRNYYEHVIRNEAEYERNHKYIQGNRWMWEGDQLNPSNLYINESRNM